MLNISIQIDTQIFLLTHKKINILQYDSEYHFFVVVLINLDDNKYTNIC